MKKAEYIAFKAKIEENGTRKPVRGHLGNGTILFLKHLAAAGWLLSSTF